jgi:hypothetical protein
LLELRADQIVGVIADLDLYTRGEIVALGLNVDANLRSSPPIGTPVDTGWARANWLPSVGEPRIIDASVRKPQPADVAARGAVQQMGLNQLLGWKLEDGPIFDSNNVTYIGVLNAGHSKQSPPGFVQLALVKAVQETESAGANRAARFRRANSFAASKPRPKR